MTRSQLPGRARENVRWHWKWSVHQTQAVLESFPGEGVGALALGSWEGLGCQVAVGCHRTLKVLVDKMFCRRRVVIRNRIHDIGMFIEDNFRARAGDKFFKAPGAVNNFEPTPHDEGENCIEQGA